MHGWSLGHVRVPCFNGGCNITRSFAVACCGGRRRLVASQLERNLNSAAE